MFDKEKYMKDYHEKWYLTNKEHINKRVIARTQEKKRWAVKYKGGKCCICGYNKCLAALDFHHTIGSGRDTNYNMLRFGKERLKKELDKCVLVCSNCHREIHHARQETPISLGVKPKG